MKKSIMTLFALAALARTNMISSAPSGSTATVQNTAADVSSMIMKYGPDVASGLAAAGIPSDIQNDLQAAVKELGQANPTSGINAAMSEMIHDKQMRKMVMGNDENDKAASGDVLEAYLHKLDTDAQNAFMQLRSDFQSAVNSLRSHHMDRIQKDQGMIHDMMSKSSLRAVEDAKGNFIGGYKPLGEVKGYRYGLLYNTSLNQTPVSVIESGLGTPANVAIPGASSTILGYLDNPNFNGSMGSPKQIMLLQYTMPAQPMDIMPVHPKTDVKVQAYHHDEDCNDENCEDCKHHNKHHHNNDNDGDKEKHHLITLF